MYLHIEFSDGSNPKLYIGRSEMEIRKELQKWQRHYTLEIVKLTEGGINVKATEK